MQQENVSVDALIEDIKTTLGEFPEETVDEVSAETIAGETPQKVQKKPSVVCKILAGVGKALLVIFETVLLLAVALYGVMFVLAKGPSTTARDLFVRSVQETSAVGFLANLYFSQEEIDQITSANAVPEYEEMDTSLIEIPKPDDSASDGKPKPDAWGLVDEDGDGIIIEEVKGTGFAGFMMIIPDPSQVIMGSVPSSYDARGYTVAQMVEHFDALAGINAGGFEDVGGMGNGSEPDTMTVYDGVIYYAEKGSHEGFAGFDRNHILHVGIFNSDDVRARDIQYGVSFGPVLVVNGVMSDAAARGSGVNPRTAIGQRSDGAVLLLVIDGRQVTSLGATYVDLAEVFLSYGAVNACNLDGGSSSMMWYQGGYINNGASVIGIRPVPTSFLVLKKEGVSQ